jgi:hypothetical protein
MILKVRTSKSMCPDIEDLSKSKNAPSISVRDIEVLIFEIYVRVLQYWCFFVGSCLGGGSSYWEGRGHWPAATERPGPGAIWILDGQDIGYLPDIVTPDIGIFPISEITYPIIADVGTLLMSQYRVFPDIESYGTRY